MKEPTRPDLLARYDALPDKPGQRKFESKHSLPENLIGKMRMGCYHSRAAERTVAAFEDAITREESGRPPAEAGERPQGRPTLASTLSGEDAEAREDLVQACDSANDIASLDEAGRKATVALLEGVITDGTARVLKEMLGERRQAILARIKQEELARGQEEMIIRVVFVRNWTGGPLPREGK